MKPTEILEIIIRAVPYPAQISAIELESNAVLFTWRSDRFRVSESLSAEKVEGGFLIGDNIAIMLSSLLKANV